MHTELLRRTPKQPKKPKITEFNPLSERQRAFYYSEIAGASAGTSILPVTFLMLLLAV